MASSVSGEVSVGTVSRELSDRWLLSFGFVQPSLYFRLAVGIWSRGMRPRSPLLHCVRPASCASLEFAQNQRGGLAKYDRRRATSSSAVSSSPVFLLPSTPIRPLRNTLFSRPVTALDRQTPLVSMSVDVPTSPSLFLLPVCVSSCLFPESDCLHTVGRRSERADSTEAEHQSPRTERERAAATRERTLRLVSAPTRAVTTCARRAAALGRAEPPDDDRRARCTCVLSLFL